MMKLSDNQLKKLPYKPEYDALEGWELLLVFCRRFQEVTNINPYQYLQTIWGYSKPNHIYSFTRPDGNAWTYEHALLIQNFTGVDWFARWLAHRSSLRIIENTTEQAPLTTLLKVIKENSDVASCVAAVIEDQTVTEREYSLVKAEVNEAVESMQGLLESLQRRVMK